MGGHEALQLLSNVRFRPKLCELTSYYPKRNKQYVPSMREREVIDVIATVTFSLLGLILITHEIWQYITGMTMTQKSVYIFVAQIKKVGC